mmetsp:Transcript_5201/g.13960  ORF Transcript_5201/g.13960 Transcript_5201/m.13960 type:complete len:134 (-) Transcript_5201:902-1303(-)|eukprot:CAMPEP_0185842062 /NCGR_PEP_ID=MMETSP1353-20130828/18217_1 /TAXON_ID=1077150 /ORGANISM="Erythrolobus australicus, Strain CCMP3124" /LENGTH=133 /DNA_ID=CAMNT_0028541559 /DNA_START=439 /DNA_END=840 /DNA_ORIENTATION=-
MSDHEGRGAQVDDEEDVDVEVEVDEDDDDDDNDDNDDDDAAQPAAPPPPKKPKIAGKMKRNSDGDKYLQLPGNKRVTIRVFKGRVGIDIREFYEKDGKMLPGKKGIWLTEEQWNAVMRSQDELKDTVATALDH